GTFHPPTPMHHPSTTSHSSTSPERPLVADGVEWCGGSAKSAARGDVRAGTVGGIGSMDHAWGARRRVAISPPRPRSAAAPGAGTSSRWVGPLVEGAQFSPPSVLSSKKMSKYELIWKRPPARGVTVVTPPAGRADSRRIHAVGRVPPEKTFQAFFSNVAP